MDYVTLMGAEQVATAGRQMDMAAETIRLAAGSIEEACRGLQRSLEEHGGLLRELIDTLQDIQSKAESGRR